MAQIITYPKLSTLANDDLLLVSDVSSVNKTTNSLEIDTLAQHIIITNNVIKGGGTLRSIAMFTPTGAEIGDAIMRQNAGGTEIELGGNLLVNNSLEVQDNAAVNNNLTVDNQSFLNGVVDMGAALNVGGVAFFASTVEFDDDVTFNNRIADNVGSFGTAGQVLSSTGSGVQWTSDGGGTVTGTGATNSLPIWTDGPAGVLGNSSISESPTTVTVDADFETTGSATFPDAVNINFATSSSKGIIFNHPAGGASGIVNMYYNGAGAGSRFVISRAATGGAEIELQSNGDINLNRLGNGNLLVGGEVTFDDYGSGTITGTATRSLAVDASGKVIEEPLPSGSTTILINGLVNNLASAGSGGYDFMEWVSNVTSATQIPVMKTPRDIVLKSVSYSWMGDTALSIGPGEQVAFTIGTIPSGVNPVIANYTSVVSLFDLTNADDGTYANDVVTGLSAAFGVGDVIAVVGQETGTVTPNSGELSLCFEFEVS